MQVITVHESGKKFFKIDIDKLYIMVYNIGVDRRKESMLEMRINAVKLNGEKFVSTWIECNLLTIADMKENTAYYNGEYKTWCLEFRGGEQQ